MYEAFFGLHGEPFSIAPDPRFLYMSDKHREALGLLVHGLQRGASFVLLTGEIGAGKTTVWRRFLEQLPPTVDVANVVNPKLDVGALLARVCEDLHVPLPESGRPVDLIDALHGHLLLAQAQGRRTLIVIDEAQALSAEVLEQLRLLTNLDSTGKKLQVMLIAQPEMRQILEQPELEPLNQRVVMRYHLPALDESETAAYMSHRLTVAGLTGPIPFDHDSIGLVHRLCRGVPRRINVLCDLCLVAAHQAGVKRVDRDMVVEAAAKVFGVRPKLPPPPAAEPAAPARAAGAPRGVVLAGLALAALGAGSWLGPKLMPSAAAPAAPAMAAPAMAAAPAVTAPAPPPVSAPVAAVAPAAAPPPAEPLVPAAARPPLQEALFSPVTAEEASAWRALAQLWGASLGERDACAAAASAGLQCYRAARGSLATVRQLDRPGILRLSDERGRVAHVLLKGLDGDTATLLLGGVPRTVPLAELAPWWRGEFATLWRVPPGWFDGEGGVAPAAWVAQHLAVLDGQRQASAAAGEALRTRITAFQVLRGLTPDGVAGPLTLMLLNAASGVDEPRLGTSLTSGNRPS